MLCHTSFSYLFSIYFIVNVKSQMNCSNLIKLFCLFFVFLNAHLAE